MSGGAQRPSWEYIDAVMVGGNHLADVLMRLGVDVVSWRRGEYEDVRREHGQTAADVWVAWRAIMDWREQRPNPLGINLVRASDRGWPHGPSSEPPTRLDYVDDDNGQQ